MEGIVDLLDRAIPDRCSTAGLPVTAAAEIDWLAGRGAQWTDPRPDVSAGVRARALVGEGQFAPARRLLSERGPDDDGPQDLAAAVWAASRVGSSAVIDALTAQVAQLPEGFVTAGDLPLCPRAQLEGLLAASRGDLPEGARRLQQAVDAGDLRAPVWGALARLELGRVLRAGGTTDPRARRVLTSAATFFGAGGYQHLAARARACQQPAKTIDAAAPGLGHLVPGARWSVGFGVVPVVEVAETKGLRAVAHLVANGHRSVTAVELDRVLAGGPTGGCARLDPDEVEQLLHSDREPTEVHALVMDDRVRSRISKLLSRTIAKLGDVHPALATHLTETVSTGYLCRYSPPSGVVWRLWA